MYYELILSDMVCTFILCLRSEKGTLDVVGRKRNVYCMNTKEGSIWISIYNLWHRQI